MSQGRSSEAVTALVPWMTSGGWRDRFSAAMAGSEDCSENVVTRVLGEVLDEAGCDSHAAWFVQMIAAGAASAAESRGRAYEHSPGARGVDLPSG